MTDRQRLARVERALERNEEAARRLMMVSRVEVASLDQRQADVLDQCRSVAVAPDVPLALSRRLVESGWSTAAALDDEREQAAAILAARHDEWTKRNVRLDAVRRLVARREATAANASRLREARELQDLVSIASVSNASVSNASAASGVAS